MSDPARRALCRPAAKFEAASRLPAALIVAVTAFALGIGTNLRAATHDNVLENHPTEVALAAEQDVLVTLVDVVDVVGDGDG